MPPLSSCPFSEACPAPLLFPICPFPSHSLPFPLSSCLVLPWDWDKSLPVPAGLWGGCAHRGLQMSGSSQGRCACCCCSSGLSTAGANRSFPPTHPAAGGRGEDMPLRMEEKEQGQCLPSWRLKSLAGALAAWSEREVPVHHWIPLDPCLEVTTPQLDPTASPSYGPVSQSFLK